MSNNQLVSSFCNLNLNIGVPPQPDENVGAEVSYHLAGLETDPDAYPALEVDLVDANGNTVEAGDMPYAEAADAVVESLLRSRAPIRITIHSEPPKVSNGNDHDGENSSERNNRAAVYAAQDVNNHDTSDKSLENNKKKKASCSGCCRAA
ncbi:hypothetical protein D9619_012034 [Psilocybe cf. subviscida]|uniref:Uncharacterized protein n=1 Tax=Psilocybe cf. subviscida TaxID=2480587 RepID=A0A8H5EZC4_9AGAR|nr:hypothetical protein D9619_012034 [Psilocybe cf. subviscida]